jgi:hypothetical protein
MRRRAGADAARPPSPQEVFDNEGRKRLHGAFTGGFSAGYFNTVGSKEGWTPATFVSSRSNRAKIAAQRTEDFMDAEDVAEQTTGGKQVAPRRAPAAMRAALLGPRAHTLVPAAV